MEPVGMPVLYDTDSTEHGIRCIPCPERLRERMVTSSIGQIIPPILFCLFANPTLDRIVVDINKIAAGLLVTVFGYAPKRAFEERSFPMANLVVLPGENGRDVPFEGGQVALPVRNDTSVNVIRHLAQLQDMDIVLFRKRAEDSEIHQMVADAVKNDVAFDCDLIKVVDNTTVKTAIPSPHGFLTPALDLPAM